MIGIRWNPRCPHCKRKKSYSERWDAYFCQKCNAWLESICRAPDCEYCGRRPAKPMAEASL